MSTRRIWLKKVILGTMGLGIRHLRTYASPIPEQDNPYPGNTPIQLGLNENPYGPSPLALIAMKEHISLSNRYHWEQTPKLVSAIAKKNNVNSDNILMGAGSTEILKLILQYTASKNSSFIVTNPTYDYWTYPAKILGCKKIDVPLTKDKQHDLTAMIKAIEPSTTMIYICNPNNPTGTICERNSLLEFIEEATKKALVVVDEAYLNFTNQQSIGDIAVKNNNLIITKTFSKLYGLAGGRIGYAIANTSTIDELMQLQSWPPESISVPSVAGALASLQDVNFVEKTLSRNQEVRNFTIEQLERINIHCIPSNTNFIYFSLSNYKKDFFKQLENNNIIGTRIFEEKGKWTRITVGTMQQMEVFISALE